MTDKQIIIDGVDVSGCKHYKNRTCIADYCLTDMPFGEAKCELNPNCYYKLYKRKEQDYEELRQYHNNCCKENAKKETEWLEKFNQISIGFYNGDYCNTEHCSLLKAKEQECEGLKKEKAEILEKTGMIETLQGYTVKDIEYMEQQLDQLKEENDELKKKYNIYTCGVCGNKDECNQLKSENKHLNDLLNQALKEIEAIQDAYEERE